MDPRNQFGLMMTRRHFFGLTSAGIGSAALGSILNPSAFATPTDANDRTGGF